MEGDRSIKFHFPDCGKLPPPVLAINSVSFSYDGKKENYLYTKLELSVDLDSRIALIGPNGVSLPRPSPAALINHHCRFSALLVQSSPDRLCAHVAYALRRRRASRRC